MVRDEDIAQLEVPVTEPTKDPVNEPVIGAVKLLSCRELDTVPAGRPDGATKDADNAALLVPRNPTAPFIELV
jgi:hypothetical protein